MSTVSVKFSPWNEDRRNTRLKPHILTIDKRARNFGCEPFNFIIQILLFVTLNYNKKHICDYS